MRRVIDNGQFSFLLGGWCMNDEAVTTYKAMIEQNGLGLKWLRDQFGCQSRPHSYGTAIINKDCQNFDSKHRVYNTVF